jgi:16S rRNA (cytosine967-C5)-methyltransferase
VSFSRSGSAGRNHPQKRGARRPAGGSAKAGKPRDDQHRGKDLPAGLAARQLAARAVSATVSRGLAIEAARAEAQAALKGPPLEARDRSFARLVTTATLRRLGTIDHLLARCLAKPLPEDTGGLRSVLRTAVAQLVLLETAPHAAIGQAVDLVRLDARARRFDKLTNAVLRRIAREASEVLPTLDPVALELPPDMLESWSSAYGPAVAREIAAASLTEASLDLSVKSDAAGWALALGGAMLPGGSVRLPPGSGRIEDLAGYGDGAWWVQDAAAAVPVKALGDMRGLSVADLCAAPGGKTAQLACAGAAVTAVDLSARRLKRVAENLRRLALDADLVEADLRTWMPGRMFDVVVLDAPCSATGTIRRHPDILRPRTRPDLATLAARQDELISAASRWVADGGRLLYCTCSLEPQECEDVISRFLTRAREFSLVPLHAGPLGLRPESVTAAGMLRTLPHHAFASDDARARGMDGFFAALLHKA